MPSPPSVKLTFQLSEDERGPYPVSTESIWCKPEGDYFRIENVPFFLEDLSFDDLVSVVEDASEPGTWRIGQRIEESGYSTIWVLVQDAAAGMAVLDRAVALGCSREGGVLPDLFAVSVPPTVDIQPLMRELDAATQAGALMADYPSFRH